MNIKSLFYKIYWGLKKRLKLTKQKSYNDWLSKGYVNKPKISFIIQSHNKSYAVRMIVDKLRNYPNSEIIVIDDGSKPKHTKYLTKYLTKGNEFLIRSNDLYENVMYDKTIRFANGEFIALLQDDDEIVNLKWVDKALYFFEKHSDMVILGGLNGLDFKISDENEWGYVDEYEDKTLMENGFCFVHSVNRAPMLLKKNLYSEKLKHIDFSFAPFQCDDCELCLRAWLSGLKVGWYNAGFKSISAGGMRIWNNGLIGRQELTNRNKLFQMYKNSVDHISCLVRKANERI